jgi:transposase
MLCLAIDNPASCEIRTVIRFLHAINMNAAEIHNELCAVYGKNIMSKGTVRRCCRMFKDGRTNVHNEERNGRPSAVSDNFIQSFDQKNCERRHFTIQKFRVNFHKFHAFSSTRLSQLG